jgi:hypothetical protein
MIKEGEECPRCGKKGFKILEIPEWANNRLRATISCWNCDLYVSGSIDFIPEHIDRNCVACNQNHRPVGRENPELCSRCKDKEIIETLSTFDIVVPSDTGKVWKNQTGGVACSNRWVEGKRIELDKPMKQESERYQFERDRIDDGNLLYALQRANYDYDKDLINKIWNDLREELWFEFEDADAPDGEQTSTEAFRWIRITSISDDYSEVPVENPEELLKEKVVLRYPNCD